MTYYQIKSSRINMGGWGKGIEALNLLQLGKAYNGRSRMNTQIEALITRRETTPFDRYDVTAQRMWPA